MTIYLYVSHSLAGRTNIDRLLLGIQFVFPDMMRGYVAISTFLQHRTQVAAVRVVLFAEAGWQRSFWTGAVGN